MIHFTSELIIDTYPLINPLRRAYDANTKMTNRGINFSVRNTGVL